LETLVEKEMSHYIAQKESGAGGSLDKYEMSRRSFDYNKDLSYNFEDRMGKFMSDNKKSERYKYLQCWDLITKMRTIDSSKTDIKDYNEIVASTMDLLIRKERHR
jgi:hypothetical protein